MFFEFNRWELSSKPQFENAFDLSGGEMTSRVGSVVGAGASL